MLCPLRSAPEPFAPSGCGDIPQDNVRPPTRPRMKPLHLRSGRLATSVLASQRPQPTDGVLHSLNQRWRTRPAEAGGGPQIPTEVGEGSAKADRGLRKLLEASGGRRRSAEVSGGWRRTGKSAKVGGGRSSVGECPWRPTEVAGDRRRPAEAGGVGEGRRRPEKADGGRRPTMTERSQMRGLEAVVRTRPPRPCGRPTRKRGRALRYGRRICTGLTTRSADAGDTPYKASWPGCRPNFDDPHMWDGAGRAGGGCIRRSPPTTEGSCAMIRSGLRRSAGTSWTGWHWAAG